MMQGSILSHKPGVINMPSWKGVVNDAQANAIAAYILAGFPQVAGRRLRRQPGFGLRHLHGLRLHHLPRPGRRPSATPAPAPNPLSPDKAVPLLRNPADNVTIADMTATILDGSIPPPGKVGEVLMPAWGQILSTQQLAKVLPYIPDGPKGAKRCPPRPPPPTLPLASGSASASTSASPAASSSP